MKNDLNAKIIVTTAYDDSQEMINQMIKLGAHAFLPKPMNRMTLMKTITDSLYHGKVSGNHNQICKSVVLEQN